MLTVYNDSIQLEETIPDPTTGEEYVQLVSVSSSTLMNLKAVVKVDITPRGAFDKYAQEQSIENLLTAGLFSSERIPELKLYIKTLDDDSVMPKAKLEKLVEEWELEQQKITQINAKAQLVQQSAQQYFMGVPEI